MSKMDEMVERMQERAYWEHHERLNVLLAQRLRARSREEVLQSLFSVDALAMQVVGATEKGLQSI